MHTAEIRRRRSWTGQGRSESTANHRCDRTCKCNAVRSPTPNKTTYASVVVTPDNSWLSRVSRAAKRAVLDWRSPPTHTKDRRCERRKPKRPRGDLLLRPPLRAVFRIAPHSHHAGATCPTNV